MKYLSVEQQSRNYLVPVHELSSVAPVTRACAETLWSGSQLSHIARGDHARRFYQLSDLLGLPKGTLKRGSRILDLKEDSSSVLVELVCGVLEIEKTGKEAEIVKEGLVYHFVSLRELVKRAGVSYGIPQGDAL